METIREDVKLSLAEILVPGCKVVARIYNPLVFVMVTSPKWSAL